MKLRFDLLKLREQVTPRRLSSEQKNEIASSLREFKELPAQLDRELVSPEVRDISDDILTALGPQGAGWSVGDSSSPDAKAMRGITVEVLYAATPKSVTAARTLVESLRHDGLMVTGPDLSRLARRGDAPAEPRAMQIKITVGRKP